MGGSIATSIAKSVCNSAGSNAFVKRFVLFVLIDSIMQNVCVYTVDFVSGHK